MGGGKRNYNTMRAKHRQWKKTEVAPEPEDKKKEVSKEDKEALLALWEESKKKKKKEEKENATGSS